MSIRERAALRIAAIEWAELPIGRQAAARLDARRPDQAATAMVLWQAMTEAASTPNVSEDDHRTLILGAVSAAASARDDREAQARLTQLLAAGAASGLSYRALGDAAGISHTAVAKRLRRRVGSP